VLKYCWRKEATNAAGLVLLNMQVEVGELAGYLISVAAPHSSAELEHLAEDLESFVGCLKGVSKPVVPIGSKDELCELAII